MFDGFILCFVFVSLLALFILIIRNLSPLLPVVGLSNSLFFYYVLSRRSTFESQSPVLMDHTTPESLSLRSKHIYIVFSQILQSCHCKKDSKLSQEESKIE